MNAHNGAMESHNGAMKAHPGAAAVCRPLLQIRITLMRIRIHPQTDPHQSEKSDPDPYRSANPDTDPHQGDTDTQHCLAILLANTDTWRAGRTGASMRHIRRLVAPRQ